MQPRIHCTFADTQNLSSINGAYVLHVSENEYFTITLVQTSQRSSQRVAQFLALQLFRRNVAPIDELSGLISYHGKISREELVRIPIPATTETHKPVAHHKIVESLVESLSFRHIGVVHEEYAVSDDGMKMFGVLDLETLLIPGCRFAIGIRNSHDKSMRLALTIGARVLVCMNMSFHGDFEPILAKHSKSFSLVDSISVGVDRMQRNFEPMRRQVQAWQSQQLSTAAAKLTIYRAFVEGAFGSP